jgi:dTDP-4-amino-4,6-dideoxygalactose transaminase
VTVFSFHPVKILTTGEGGMLLAKRAELDAAFKLLRSHGVTRDQGLMDAAPDGPWYYQQLELGYNYRITDIQAALGVSQLARLEAFLDRRRAIAARYCEKLAGLPLVLPHQYPDCQSSWHLFVIRIPAGQGRTRDQVMDGLRASGINANVHYIPVHTQPYYRKLGFKPGDFPQAEAYYAEAISLPMYYSLSDADQDYIAERLRALLS